MRSVLRSNARWVKTLVGVEDDYAVDFTNGLARALLTQSPSSRGAQGVDNYGLPGDGVNSFDTLTGSLQGFVGASTTPLAAPRGAIGDRLSGSMPGPVGPAGSVAWMDLGKRGALGFSG